MSLTNDEIIKIHNLAKRHELAPDTGLGLYKIASDIANKIRIDQDDVDELFEEVAETLVKYAADMVLEQEGLRSI